MIRKIVTNKREHIVELAINDSNFKYKVKKPNRDVINLSVTVIDLEDDLESTISNLDDIIDKSLDLMYNKEEVNKLSNKNVRVVKIGSKDYEVKIALNEENHTIQYSFRNDMGNIKRATISYEPKTNKGSNLVDKIFKSMIAPEIEKYVLSKR